MSRFPNRPVKPQVESLEDRLALTVNHSVTGTVLTMRGDAGHDLISIEDPGTAAGVRIRTNGVWRTIASPITAIQVNTAGGHDSVTYHLMGNMQAGVTRRVVANLAAGFDRFDARLYNHTTGVGSDLTRGSALTLVANGGADLDSLKLDATRDVDIAGSIGRASLTVDYWAGSGDDVVEIGYRGNMDGDLFLDANGQEGSDNIAARLTFDFGSRGILAGTSDRGVGTWSKPARVHGWTEPDTLRFEVRNSGLVIVSALMEGGTWWDTGWRTSNVVPVWVESDFVVT